MERSAGRVVLTASEVHDPSSKGGSIGSGATLGSLAGLRSRDFIMIDGGKFDADKAYKDSKLCNLLMMRELDRQLRARNSSAVCTSFGPGLITRSGFFKSTNPLFLAAFDVAANDLFKVAETVDGGGECLVRMALSPETATGGSYWNNDVGPGFGEHTFHPATPSAEARSDEEAAELWRLSAELTA